MIELRDMLAAVAMLALRTNAETFDAAAKHAKDTGTTISDVIADWAYVQADALIRRRMA